MTYTASSHALVRMGQRYYAMADGVDAKDNSECAKWVKANPEDAALLTGLITSATKRAVKNGAKVNGQGHLAVNQYKVVITSDRRNYGYIIKTVI